MVSDPPANAIAAGSMIDVDRTWDWLSGMAVKFMGVYYRYIFPRLCEWAMRDPRFDFPVVRFLRTRRDILEIGLGTGLNRSLWFA